VRGEESERLFLSILRIVEENAREVFGQGTNGGLGAKESREADSVFPARDCRIAMGGGELNFGIRGIIQKVLFVHGMPIPF